MKMSASRDIVFNALRGEPAPRVPVVPLAVHFCARVTGVTLDRYTRDADALAAAVIAYHERFRPDAVILSADTWVSAQAMGAAVGPIGEQQPWGGLGEPRVRTLADVKALPEPDVAHQGRYPLMLDALRRIVAAVGRDTAVVACFDQYPFSLAAALMGLNELMLAVHDDPALVQALMERCHRFSLAYGRALAEAGADVLTGGDSPAGLIGPERYREFAWPWERRVIADLKAATGKPVSLHICGNAEPILADMARTGADVLEIDYRTDLALAARTVGPDVTLWGNLDPVAVLAHGTPATVRAAARQALTAMSGRRRFILGSGCTLAVETPFENVDALIRIQSLEPRMDTN